MIVGNGAVRRTDILTTIQNGRQATMPPLASALGGEGNITATAVYVQSLSGQKVDPLLANDGKQIFSGICAALPRCRRQGQSGYRLGRLDRRLLAVQQQHRNHPLGHPRRSQRPDASAQGLAGRDPHAIGRRLRVFVVAPEAGRQAPMKLEADRPLDHPPRPLAQKSRRDRVAIVLSRRAWQRRCCSRSSIRCSCATSPSRDWR
jgi:hypothetical protein